VRPTVLLVEDEPGVRMVARLGLQFAQYEVLEAADGAGAVRASEGHTGPIHLLLTDVNLPDMSGEEVAVAVRARHPEAKVVLTSGAAVPHSGRVPDAAFVQKPFTPTTLALKVRDVLGG